MEKGHFGEYTGNARCCKTPVTKRNYRSSVADDAAHIHYLEEDMKYDKKHHSPFKQVDEREGRVVQPFVDPGAPEGFESSMGENYDEEAASRMYLKKQGQVQDALNTLEKIESGYTPDIPFVNPKKIVTNAFLGSEQRKGRMTPEELAALNRSSAQDAYAYLSSNIRNAPLGDAGSYFHKKYNPTKLR